MVCIKNKTWFTSSGVAENITGNIEILPDDEGFHGSELEALEGVIDTETIPPSVLTNLVKVSLDEPLLLNKLDVRQRFACKLDSLYTKVGLDITKSEMLAAHLIKAIFTPITDINDLDDFRNQSLVKHVTLAEFRFEIGASSEDKTGDINFVVRDEVLHSQFSNFSDIIVSLLVSKSRETQRRLASTPVFLWKVNSKLVNDVSGVSSKSAEQ